MIDEALFDAEEKMEKAVAVARDDLATIRTGRANPGMFSRIAIDYYGAMTPITQLCSINVPEARMVVIKPYEASQLGAIETAIRNSDLGLNPSNDGSLIRWRCPSSPRSGAVNWSSRQRARARTPRSRYATFAARRWRSCTASARTATPVRTRSAGPRRTSTSPPSST